MNKDSYRKAIDNIKFSENLSEKTLDYLSTQLSQTETKQKPMKSKRLRIAFAAVACVCMLAIIITAINGRSDFELPNSVGRVSVRYVKWTPILMSQYSLVPLTEEEIFNKDKTDIFHTDIFRGRIEEIRNIKISFNGEPEYNSIAKIKVEKVYRGSAKAGETVSVRIPCPINTGIWVEDTEVVSSMRDGMEGIFMPVKYDGRHYAEMNGARIQLKDIAPYGFMDGVRYAFLKGDKGLIFSRFAYETIASAKTLEEVEQYIMKMIK